MSFVQYTVNVVSVVEKKLSEKLVSGKSGPDMP